MESARPEEQIEIVGESPQGFRLLPSFITSDEHDAIARWCEAHVPVVSPNPARPPELYYEEFHPTEQTDPREFHRDSRRSPPHWAQVLKDRMLESELFGAPPNHLHLLRYSKGTGLYLHVDPPEQFGETVAGLTLASTRIFVLIRPGRGRMRVLLFPGDLYVMSGEAQYQWKHGIPPAERDEFRGETYERCHGFSTTWRRVTRQAPRQ